MTTERLSSPSAHKAAWGIDHQRVKKRAEAIAAAEWPGGGEWGPRECRAQAIEDECPHDGATLVCVCIDCYDAAVASEPKAPGAEGEEVAALRSSLAKAEEERNVARSRLGEALRALTDAAADLRPTHPEHAKDIDELIAEHCGEPDIAAGDVARFLDASRTALAKAEAERDEARGHLASLRSEREALRGGYRGYQTIANEVIAFLEAAGCGKPGTPNTMWAMTREIIASRDAALAERDRLREALRGLLLAIVDHNANPTDSDGPADPWAVCTVCGHDGDPNAPEDLKHDPTEACGVAAGLMKGANP